MSRAGEEPAHGQEALGPPLAASASPGAAAAAGRIKGSACALHLQQGIKVCGLNQECTLGLALIDSGCKAHSSTREESVPWFGVS